MKIICVVSARPNFMKIAPLIEAFKAQTDVRPLLLHTGQHYDDNMSGVFFRKMSLPEPDFWDVRGRVCRRTHSENNYSTMETLTNPAATTP